MPYISKITLPSGTVYDLKDAWARDKIAVLTGGDAVVFIGVSSTPLTDNGTEKPIIDGVQVTPAAGQLFFYGTQEFIWGKDNKWHALGSLESLGALAYKNSASGDFTPSGNISSPTFTGVNSDVTFSIAESTSGNYSPAGNISGGSFTGSNTTFTGTFTPNGSISVTTETTVNKTTTVSPATSGNTTYTPEGQVAAPTINLETAGSTTKIKNPTKQTVAKTVVAAAPGATAPANALTYYNVTDETLSLYQLGYTTGDSITTTEVAVKNGDAIYTATAPKFTGTGVRLVTGNISVPATYTGTFTGQEGNVSTSGIPNGNNGALTFTGTKVNITGTTTAKGDVSAPIFTGTQGTVTVS